MRQKLLMAAFLVSAVWLVVYGRAEFGSELGIRSGPGGTVSAEEDLRFEAEMRIISASPRGELHGPVRDIRVEFNRPMVPLGIGMDTVAELFTIEPELSGHFRWVGQNTLIFTAAHVPEFATKYTVTVPPGVESFDGKELEDTYSFSFITPTIAVQSVQPSNREDLGPNEKLTIHFTQPVDATKARSHIHVTNSGGESFPIKIAGGPSGQILTIVPETKWPQSETLRLSLTAGLPSESGPVGMVREHAVPYRTYGPPQFLGLGSSDHNHPYNGITFRFNTRVSAAELAGKIRFNPAVKIPTVRERGYRSRNNDVYLPLQFKPGAKYTFTIDKSLKSIHGLSLAASEEGTFWTRNLPASFSVGGSGRVVIPPSDSPALTLNLTNVDHLEVKIVELSPAKFLRNDRYPVGQKGAIWRIQPEQNVPTTRRLFLKDFGEIRDTGFYAVLVRKLGQSSYWSTTHIQITRLGVTAKFGPEATEAWVTDLDSARSIANARARIIDIGAGKILWEGRTDTNGLITAPGWEELGIRPSNNWARPHVGLVVEDGDQTAAVSSDWNAGIEPWRFGVDFGRPVDARKVRGTVFTDRGIYRPGEIVNIKGFALQPVDSIFTTPAIDTAIVTIYSPTGDRVASFAQTFTERGGFDAEFSIPADASLGTFRILASPGTAPVENSYWYDGITGTFRVAEYEPNRTRVTVEIPSVANFGKRTSVGIRAMSLAGTPLGNRNFHAQAHLSRSVRSFPLWKEFTFDAAPTDYWRENSQDNSGDPIYSTSGLLDDAGETKISFALPVRARAELDGRDGLLTIESTVEELNGRSSTSRSARVIPGGELIAGVKTDQYCIGQGEHLVTEHIALDRDGNAVPGEEIVLQLVERTWSNTKVPSNGGFVWESSFVDTVVRTVRITSETKAVRHTWERISPGSYFVSSSVTDGKDNTMSASTWTFYVYGGDLSWWRTDDDRIEIIPDKRSYEPGDTARLLIRSPYRKARAWVTVERSGVRTVGVHELSGNAPTIDVPVRKEYFPNVYVSVVLLDTSRDSAGIPFKMGLTELTVADTTRRLDVDVQAGQTEYQPGDTVVLSLSLKGANGEKATGEIALAVVDEAVTSLVSHRFPDLHAVFYRAFSHFITTVGMQAYLVDLASLGEKGEAAGGGGGELDVERPVSLRKDFSPTAVWKATVVTDEDGLATVEFRLPESVTTYRIFAAAVDNTLSRFGNDETSLAVRKKISLEAALPRFVRSGDSFLGGVIVRNMSGRDDTVVVKPIADSGTKDVVEGRERSIFLKNQSETAVKWSFNAPVLTTPLGGKMTLRFTAATDRHRDGRYRDGLEVELPIAAPNSELFDAVSGSLADSAVTLPVRSPAEIVGGSLNINFSTTALVKLGGALEYLLQYPYGCLEQRTSRVYPLILIGPVASELGLEHELASKEAVSELVNNYIRQLRRYEITDGYALWQGGDRAYPWVNALVAKTLMAAEKQGHKVDRRIMDHVLNYVRGHFNRGFDGERHPYSARALLASEAAFAEVLAEAGRLKPAELEPLYSQRNQLPLAGLASLYRAAVLSGASKTVRDDLGTLIRNHLVIFSRTAYFEEKNPDGLGWIYHSNVTATAACLQALMTGDDDFSDADKVIRWLLSERKNGSWRSTRENAAVAGALAQYYERYENEEVEMEVELYLERSLAGTFAFEGRSTETRSTAVPLRKSSADQSFDAVIVRKGSGRLYYEAVMRAVVMGELPKLTRGISVNRELTDLDGSPVDLTALEAGKVYRLRHTVDAPHDFLWVVLDGALPGGLEAIDLTLDTSRSGLRIHIVHDISKGWWSRGFEQSELRDDRVVFFADSMRAGTHTVDVLVRAVTPGRFNWPGASAELMYEPEVMGRTVANSVVIR